MSEFEKDNLPDFEIGSELSGLTGAFDAYVTQRQVTFEEIKQWVENPEFPEDEDSVDLFDETIKAERDSYKKLVKAYRKSDQSDEQKLDALSWILIEARETRLKFLNRLLPELELTEERPERYELLDDMKDRLKKEGWLDLKKQGWELCALYRDELASDLKLVVEVVEPEFIEDEEEFVEEGGGLSKYLVDTSKISFGVASGLIIGWSYINRRRR